MAKQLPTNRSTSMTISDHLPTLFNVDLLKKRAVQVLETSRDRLVLQVGSQRIEYLKKITDWTVRLEVNLLKDRGVGESELERTRLVVNGTPDKKAIEFWEAVHQHKIDEERNARDRELGTIFGVLKEVLDDHPDYQ